MAIDIGEKVKELVGTINIPDNYTLKTIPTILTARFGPNLWLGNDDPLDMLLLSVMGTLSSTDWKKPTKVEGRGLFVLSDGQEMTAIGPSSTFEIYRGINRNFRINAQYRQNKCGIYVNGEPIAKNYR